jgi:hypothetical protein
MYYMKNKKTKRNKTIKKRKPRKSKTKKKYHKKTTYDIYKQQILHYKKSPQ